MMNKQTVWLQQLSEYYVSSSIIITIVLIRLVFVFLPLNYEYPDQYWQGPEIAYKIYNKMINSINIGYQTWQWTIDNPIRNPIYQYILSTGYLFVHFLFNKLSFISKFSDENDQFYQQLYDYFMERGPKLIQCLIAILSDIFIVKLFYFFFGKKQVNKYSLFIILTNHFYLTMMSRTYINSFQCALMTISYYYWLLHLQYNKFYEYKIINKFDLISRIFILINYTARPTSLIPWIIIWPYQFIYKCNQFIHSFVAITKYKTNKNMKQLFNTISPILSKNIIQIILMILSSFICGSLYFKKLLLTEWNFFYYNLILKWSQCFETHPFYYYYFIATPIILGLFGFLLLMGLYIGIFKSLDTSKNYQIQNLSFKQTVYFLLILSVVLTLMSAHKQNRFLMVLLPFMLIITLGGYLKIKKSIDNSQKRNNKIYRNLFKSFIFISLFLNFFLCYSINFYPRGGLQTLRFTRKDIDSQQKYLQKNQLQRNTYTIAYLTDSHALPGYSVILRNIILKIPNDSPQKKINNLSQVDLLITNPEKLYLKFLSQLDVKRSNNKNKIINYVIIQKKYLEFDEYIKFQKNLDSLKQKLTFQSNKKWTFLFDNYQLIFSQQNFNWWEQRIIGQDQIYLFKYKIK